MSTMRALTPAVPRPLARLLRHIAFEHGLGIGLYRRACRPDGMEWARLLKRRGTLRSMGEHCSVLTNVVITDPHYVVLGDNVRLSGCTLFGHDGAVNMVNRAYGSRIDRVGKIEIGNDVFIGHQAVVLPGTRIGSKVLIGAGAVVRGGVPDNSVLVGNPARRIGTLDDLVRRWTADAESCPWRDLVTGEQPPTAALERRRAAHFFGAGAA